MVVTVAGIVLVASVGRFAVNSIQRAYNRLSIVHIKVDSDAKSKELSKMKSKKINIHKKKVEKI